MATQTQKKTTGSAKPESRKETLEPKKVKSKVKKVISNTNFIKPMSKTQRNIILGTIGTAAIIGALRIPIIRTMAIPFLATAASKNWKTILRTVQKSR